MSKTIKFYSHLRLKPNPIPSLIMKSLIHQIKFIDKKLLPLFGVKNITDYNTFIYLPDPAILPNLNKRLTSFRKIFPIKNFNLHKTDYQIQSPEHAFNLLKKCLEITSIQFEIGTIKKRKYLRLISSNKILEKYINSTYKMSDLRTISPPPPSKTTPDTYTEKDLLQNIKQEHNETFTVYPKNLIKTTPYNSSKYITLNLRNYDLIDKILKSLHIKIKSIKLDDTDVVSQEFIGKMFAKAFYTINIGSAPVYKNTLKENYLPFLLPLNHYLRYHEVELEIDGISNTDMLSFLTFEITITHIEFYKEFATQLTDAMIEQTITDDKGNIDILRITGGMGGLRWNKFISPDKIDQKDEPPNFDRKEFMKDIKGKDISLGDLQAFKFTETDVKGENCLKPLVVKPPYDISISNEMSYFPITENYYITQNTKNLLHKFIYSPPRTCDLLDNLKFIFKTRIDPTKLNIKLEFRTFEDKFTRTLTLSPISDFIFKNESTSFYNILFATGGFNIIFTYISSSDDNPFEGMTIQLVEMWLSSILRKNAVKSNLPEISVEKLNEINK